MMRVRIFVLGLLLMAISCTNGEEEGYSGNKDLDSTETIKEDGDPAADSIIKILQGKWKELEYPFRLAEFKNKTVKFTEEGVAEKPTFREYTIAGDCPFDVNNIKNAGADDVFLVMTDKSTCEIIKVFNDTLILSGFNVSSNRDYQIIYKKAE